MSVIRFLIAKVIGHLVRLNGDLVERTHDWTASPSFGRLPVCLNINPVYFFFGGGGYLFIYPSHLIE